MNGKVINIQKWLGAGSINIFGMPFAGKDTQGARIAEMLGGVMISSGEILRSNKDNQRLQKLLAAGEIIPSDLFEEIVLPYLSSDELTDKPLILSEVGRLEGEHSAVIEATGKSGHPQKAVILLKLEDDEVWQRFEESKIDKDRGSRGDDRREVLQTRLDKFKQKVIPVLDYYRRQNLLIDIDGSLSKDEVTEAIIQKLYEKSLAN